MVELKVGIMRRATAYRLSTRKPRLQRGLIWAFVVLEPRAIFLPLRLLPAKGDLGSDYWDGWDVMMMILHLFQALMSYLAGPTLKHWISTLHSLLLVEVFLLLFTFILSPNF